ncbi:MAG: hypothetical protein JXR39_10170 [Marinilabiliaceae bacterium]|nr:hypothetical protein [Marinilabiliaceae bacterium]
MIKKKLYPVEEVCQFIRQGKKMVLSGDERLLRQLPKGNWIGGSTPYFMDREGGTCSHDLIFVDDFTPYALNFKIMSFNRQNLPMVTSNGFSNGFIFLILPFAKPIVFDFTLHSLSYADIFKNPLLGFVAGIDLEQIGVAEACVFNGLTGQVSTDGAVALFVELPDHYIARVEIINIFDQDPGSDEIHFLTDSNVQSECLINGRPANIYDYLADRNWSLQLPLIANCSGAFINRDLQAMDEKNRSVTFFAPVMRGETYKLAVPIDNYSKTFVERSPVNTGEVMYSCNCVSNYVYGKLNGKKISLLGGMGFGEIAYQLLNMTQIYLAIDEI